MRNCLYSEDNQKVYLDDKICIIGPQTTRIDFTNLKLPLIGSPLKLYFEIPYFFRANFSDLRMFICKTDLTNKFSS